MMVLAAVLMTGYANAEDPDQDHLLVGAGAKLCDIWTKDRTMSGDVHAVLSGVSLSWVLGFLSGVAIEDDNPKLLTGPNAEGIQAWIDNYCQAHPRKTIIEAGVAFVQAHPR